MPVTSYRAHPPALVYELHTLPYYDMGIHRLQFYKNRMLYSYLKQ